MKYSVEASKSNLQVFIRAEQKANRKIYPSLNDYNCLPVSGGFRFRPPVKGVGSAAFKMLDPSIMGNESLSRHVKRVRESVIDDLDLRTTQIEGVTSMMLISIIPSGILSAVETLLIPHDGLNGHGVVP